MATTLKAGDKGERVKRLQTALISLGYDLSPHGADGEFGNLTTTAVTNFQDARGLPATGVADPDTIAAMNLDPDTLEDLIEMNVDDGDGDGEVITFEPDEVDVPSVVQEKIRTCVDLVAEQHNKLLNSLFGALAQFETTVKFASAEDANPDVLGVLVSKVFEMAVDEVVSKVPGLSQAKALFDATTAELERAGKASESFQVGNWIKDQRAAIDARLRGDVTKSNRDLLQADMESDYLEQQDETGRQAIFDQINQAINSLSSVTGPSVDEMEANLYVQWINAHFKEIGEDAPGCIEYRLEYEDSTFDFESCTVKAPFGDKIDSGLNRLLDRGQLPGIQRPFDFKVRKRVCLRVDNFVGGKSWSCGWMDEEGSIIHDPVHPPAQEGLRENAWQLSVDRFKS